MDKIPSAQIDGFLLSPTEKSRIEIQSIVAQPLQFDYQPCSSLRASGMDVRQPQGQNLLLSWKPAAAGRHVFPPDSYRSKRSTQHLFSNGPDGVTLTQNARLATQFPGQGQMAARAAAPSSLRPGQIRRWNGPQAGPQAGLCHSPLTTLWWLPMFLPVKRQIVQQIALL